MVECRKENERGGVRVEELMKNKENEREKRKRERKKMRKRGEK